MTSTSPHIRLLMTIALFLAMAPLCVGATVCELSPGHACAGAERGVLGPVVKHPSAEKASKPRVAYPAPLSTLHRTSPTGVRTRIVAPAPPAPIRV